MTMRWTQQLEAQLDLDRELIAHVYSETEPASPFTPFIAHQRDQFGLGPDQARLPEHFRGPWADARVCFLGPHVLLVPTEPAPGPDASIQAYIDHYQKRPGKRDPFGHYNAIMGGAPWVSTELVHWPCEKHLALDVLKSPQGPAAADAALDVTWAMLKDSPVEVLVLTGNDALKWVLPRLGWQGKNLPGVTQLHGQTLGRFPLPGAPGRELTVVASFHWSSEMPLFVRKVAGLDGLKVSEAISGARKLITRAIADAGVSL